MKRYLKFLICLVLLGSVTISADPFKTWNWDGPTEYVNGNTIPANDVLTFTLHCNITPGEHGPPYDVEIALDDPGAPPSTEDMARVAGGTIGTYYCAATATSSAFNTTSDFSNETLFIVAADDLGYVPRPPTNLTIP